MGSSGSAGKSEENSIEGHAKEAKPKEFSRRETRRDSGGREARRDSGGSLTDSMTEPGSQMSKVEKVLQKENLKSGSLFKRDYEDKIESLERQLQKIKSDLSEKQQENENLLNLIDLKKNKFGRRLTRSSSLQD